MEAEQQEQTRQRFDPLNAPLPPSPMRMDAQEENLEENQPAGDTQLLHEHTQTAQQMDTQQPTADTPNFTAAARGTLAQQKQPPTSAQPKVTQTAPHFLLPVISSPQTAPAPANINAAHASTSHRLSANSLHLRLALNKNEIPTAAQPVSVNPTPDTMYHTRSKSKDMSQQMLTETQNQTPSAMDEESPQQQAGPVSSTAKKRKPGTPTVRGHSENAPAEQQGMDTEITPNGTPEVDLNALLNSRAELLADANGALNDPMSLLRALLVSNQHLTASVIGLQGTVVKQHSEIQTRLTQVETKLTARADDHEQAIATVVADVAGVQANLQTHQTNFTALQNQVTQQQEQTVTLAARQQHEATISARKFEIIKIYSHKLPS